jgi:hypothetical protein
MSDEFLPEHDGGPDRGEADGVATPFSFKLMIGLTVLYLGWRLVQGVVWLVEKLT